MTEHPPRQGSREIILYYETEWEKETVTVGFHSTVTLPGITYPQLPRPDTSLVFKCS